jgi:hypothetical protein
MGEARGKPAQKVKEKIPERTEPILHIIAKDIE